MMVSLLPLAALLEIKRKAILKIAVERGELSRQHYINTGINCDVGNIFLQFLQVKRKRIEKKKKIWGLDYCELKVCGCGVLCCAGECGWVPCFSL